MLVDGPHNDGAGANDLGPGAGVARGVAQQVGAEPPTLIGGVERDDRSFFVMNLAIHTPIAMSDPPRNRLTARRVQC